MKNLIMVILLSAGVATAAHAESSLIIPISGDSGETIAELNASLDTLKQKDRLPNVVELTSTMSAEAISNLLDKLNQISDKASRGQHIETSGAYGRRVEGKLACFKGEIKMVRKIYENMVDSFLSDQFGILAVSTSRPDHFGLKYDESDSGSDGTWINVARCK